MNAQAIVPTPVTLANLADSTHAVNQIANPATAASPRSRVLDWVSVEVTDAPGAGTDPVFYQQKNYMGEWIRVGHKLGNFQDDDTAVINTDFDFKA